MRTFYIISETEMKEVGMKPPDIRFYKELKKAGLWTVNNTKVYNLEMDKWEKHLAAAPVFQHRLNKKGLVSEEEFVFECGAVINCEVCDCHPHGECERMVAIPKEEKRGLPKLDTPIISEEDLKEWEKEEKEERRLPESPVEAAAKETKEEILDKYYQPKMHWNYVNRNNALKAMEEYANQFKSSPGEQGQEDWETAYDNYVRDTWEEPGGELMLIDYLEKHYHLIKKS